MFMGTMLVVFNQGRGWSAGISGLAFLEILAGIIIGLAYAIFDNNTRYTKLSVAKTATPESRLLPAIIGAVALPLGMFDFVWTNYPGILWAACIVLFSPFGFGCVIVIPPSSTNSSTHTLSLPLSVLAAAAILRSIMGAVFPLFTPSMYQNLGTGPHLSPPFDAGVYAVSVYHV
jgi:hypothetical protein